MCVEDTSLLTCAWVCFDGSVQLLCPAIGFPISHCRLLVVPSGGLFSKCKSDINVSSSIPPYVVSEDLYEMNQTFFFINLITVSRLQFNVFSQTL